MFGNRVKKKFKTEDSKLKTMKGQAAMEYLMTYGWAILVIVIVLAALWFLSGQFFKPPENCLFSQPGLSCGDTKPTIYNEGGVVKVSLQVFNQQGQKVNLHNVTCTTAAIGDVQKSWAQVSNVTSIPAGGSQVFLGQSCITKPGTFVSSPVGSDFRGQFVIWYNFENDVDPTIWRQASAAITGSVRQK